MRIRIYMRLYIRGMAIEHLHSDFSAVRIALINIAMRI